MDDPRTFGEIAAANALSDVFAMGGRVLFALSIAAFPEDLPRDVLTEIFAGASSKVREAGGTLAGGHTIRDPEPKYGLAVIGAAHPDKLLRKGGARPGDRLVLTKPLGTGVLVSGSRQGRTSDADLAAAIDGMRRLNRPASEALVATGIRAATDVTGFGLLGHGLEMARGSGHAIRLRGDRPPGPGRARASSRPRVSRPVVPPTTAVSSPRRSRSRASVPDDLVTIAHDPQTSGGLLAAVAPDQRRGTRGGLRRAPVSSTGGSGMSPQVNRASASPDAPVLAQWMTRTLRSTTPTPIPQSTSATRNASPALA